ncbi:hypothetical protein ACLBXI_28885 [Bacillus cereus]
MGTIFEINGKKYEQVVSRQVIEDDLILITNPLPIGVQDYDKDSIFTVAVSNGNDVYTKETIGENDWIDRHEFVIVTEIKI